MSTDFISTKYESERDKKVVRQSSKHIEESSTGDNFGIYNLEFGI